VIGRYLWADVSATCQMVRGAVEMLRWRRDQGMVAKFNEDLGRFMQENT
jgi:hypothetical protein